MWVIAAAETASGDGSVATATTLGAVVTFVLVVGTFTKLMLDRSGANEVSATARQAIKDARADAQTARADEAEAKAQAAAAYRARDEKAQEAEAWRQKFETEKDRGRELETQIWRLKHGTGTSDDGHPDG